MAKERLTANELVAIVRGFKIFSVEPDKHNPHGLIYIGGTGLHNCLLQFQIFAEQFQIFAAPEGNYTAPSAITSFLLYCCYDDVPIHPEEVEKATPKLLERLQEYQRRRANSMRLINKGSQNTLRDDNNLSTIRRTLKEISQD